MALVRVAVALAPLARTVPAPVLLLALRSAADVAVFSPIPRFFRASFGDFCSCFGSLFSASLYPTVASLMGFSCGPPSLVVPVCVCGVSFCGGGAVSSSSPPAGCGVDSC